MIHRVAALLVVLTLWQAGMEAYAAEVVPQEEKVKMEEFQAAMDKLRSSASVAAVRESLRLIFGSNDAAIPSLPGEKTDPYRGELHAMMALLAFKAAWENAPVSDENKIKALASLLGEPNKNLAVQARGLLGELARQNGKFSYDRLVPALTDTDTPKGPLLEYILVNAKGAIWLADHSEMNPAERERIKSQIATGQMWEKAIDYGDRPRPGESPLMSLNDRVALVRKWLQDDNWVLRIYAKTLMTKWNYWDRPEIFDAASKIEIPAKINLLPSASPTPHAPSGEAAKPEVTTRPGQPKATPSAGKPESNSWLVWLLVVIAATAGAAWLLLRKRK